MNSARCFSCCSKGGRATRTSAPCSASRPTRCASAPASALSEIGGADPDAQVGLSDYLLGQADPIGRADAVRHLQSDPEANALAQRLVQNLRLLAPKAQLPEIPEPRGGRRAAPPPPPPRRRPALPRHLRPARAHRRAPHRAEGTRLRLPRRRLLQRPRGLERQAADPGDRRRRRGARARDRGRSWSRPAAASSGGKRLQGVDTATAQQAGVPTMKLVADRFGGRRGLPAERTGHARRPAAGQQQQRTRPRRSPCRRTRSTCRPPPTASAICSGSTSRTPSRCRSARRRSTRAAT